jgi:hypothetical protein
MRCRAACSWRLSPRLRGCRHWPAEDACKGATPALAGRGCLQGSDASIGCAATGLSVRRRCAPQNTANRCPPTQRALSAAPECLSGRERPGSRRTTCPTNRHVPAAIGTRRLLILDAIPTMKRSDRHGDQPSIDAAHRRRRAGPATGRNSRARTVHQCAGMTGQRWSPWEWSNSAWWRARRSAP